MKWLTVELPRRRDLSLSFMYLHKVIKRDLIQTLLITAEHTVMSATSKCIWYAYSTYVLTVHCSDALDISVELRGIVRRNNTIKY